MEMGVIEGVDVYWEDDVTPEVVEHDVHNARAHGCRCESLSYIGGVLSEEDRRYRVIYPIHEDGCTYAVFTSRMARRDRIKPVEITEESE